MHLYRDKVMQQQCRLLHHYLAICLHAKSPIFPYSMVMSLQLCSLFVIGFLISNDAGVPVILCSGFKAQYLVSRCV